MRVLYFKGKAKEVWAEWDLCLKAIGHVKLGQLKPKEGNHDRTKL